MQLDAEIQNVLKANMEADQKIESLIHGKNQASTNEKSDQKLKTKNEEELDAYVENKWGFLRNVININSFFSNGDNKKGQPLPKNSEDLPQKKQEVKKEPHVQVSQKAADDDDGADDYDVEEKKVMSKDKDLGRLMGNEKAVL